MSLEAGAIAALTFMVGFCGILLKILWERSISCERQSDAMHATIEQQGRAIGVLEGTLRVIERCPVSGCPYRPAIRKSQPLPP